LCSSRHYIHPTWVILYFPLLPLKIIFIASLDPKSQRKREILKGKNNWRRDSQLRAPIGTHALLSWNTQSVDGHLFFLPQFYIFLYTPLVVSNKKRRPGQTCFSSLNSSEGGNIKNLISQALSCLHNYTGLICVLFFCTFLFFFIF
jgi:hypothetical protein